MSTVLEFDLSAADISRIVTVPGATVKVGICAAVLAGVGAAGVVVGAVSASAGPIVTGCVALLIAVFFVGFLWQVSRSRATLMSKLAGPTTVRLSDWGLQYSGAVLTEKFEWAKVAAVNDRPDGWLFTVRAVGAVLIPKSAVPAAQATVFTAQLRHWSGNRYRVRRR